MLYSMTGYGKSVATINDKKINVEIKTLNSKGLDIYTKIPNQFREMELEIRQIVGQELGRGKIDFSINIENGGTSMPAVINKDLVAKYYADLKAANEIVGEENVNYLSLIMKMPEIYIQSNDEITDEFKEKLYQLIREACQMVTNFRRQEGVALERDFSGYISEIRTYLCEIDQYESSRVETIKQRMLQSLKEIGSYDEVRFHQELMYYIEKLDVSEEKMRLTNHLYYFMENMKSNEMIGKKLGFIAQEMGREINTLGSKSNHAEMQKLVVNMKDALEKIKEQVLNTL